MKLWQEWGTGVTINTDEIIVSKSNDLAVAMGTGTYKKVEDWWYVNCIFVNVCVAVHSPNIGACHFEFMYHFN